MASRDSITVQKESLYRLAYTIPLTLAFLYFSKNMLFGPSTLSLPGVAVSEDLHINFQDNLGKIYLSGQSDFNRLGQEHGSIDFCRFQQNTESTGCLEEPHNQQIKVSIVDSGDDEVTCHKVQRKGLRCLNQMVKDCYGLGADHWYGGFEAVNQVWPLKKATPVTEEMVVSSEGDVSSDGVKISLGPYVTADSGIHKTNHINVLDRIFLSSSGVGIIVSKDSPLYLGFNQHGDGKLCLAAMYDGTRFFNLNGKLPKLEYHVCKAKDVKSIYNYTQRHFVQKPEGMPHRSLFTAPIWSTWAYYKKAINQTSVIEFAEKIVSLKLPVSQFEIDDEWTPSYGDLTFDPARFPDPKKMVSELTNMNLPVTLWVHPFLSLKSKAFQDGLLNKFIVMAKGSEVPALVRWWNEDMAALLDVTNPAAVLWFQNRLHQLVKDYNVTSFKFDAGEGSFLPPSHSTYGQLATSNEYSTLWSELAYSTDMTSRRQEIRVGWNTQRLPLVVRLMDRRSHWGHDSGLQSIIPAALTLGVLGYPFLLPDMIGGNAYADVDSLETGEYPDKELFVRWMQTSLFMPVLQFSIPPWWYGDDVVVLTKKLLQLREMYVPKIIQLAEESVETGYPIIRPLWWIAPDDENALIVDDEFLVGDDLLIAPVVAKGARKRDIYLPRGQWGDSLREAVIEGPVLLEDYSVALDQLPIFERKQV